MGFIHTVGFFVRLSARISCERVELLCFFVVRRVIFFGYLSQLRNRRFRVRTEFFYRSGIVAVRSNVGNALALVNSVFGIPDNRRTENRRCTPALCKLDIIFVKRILKRRSLPRRRRHIIRLRIGEPPLIVALFVVVPEADYQIIAFTYFVFQLGIVRLGKKR